MVTDIKAEAASLHSRSLVVDAHCDTLALCAPRQLDWGRRLPSKHIDLPKLRAGGVNLQVFAMFIHHSQAYRGYHALLDRMLKSFESVKEKHADSFFAVTNLKDLDSTGSESRTGGILGIEGAHVFERDPARLDEYIDRGLRVLTLTWNNSNKYATSSVEPLDGTGLSEEGRELVSKMNSKGIVIDLSHSSTQTLKDTLEVTEKPVIASHSNARALCDFPRNLTDEELELIAQNGGVVGVNFVPFFLSEKYMQKYLSTDETRRKELTRINSGLGYKSPEARKQKRALFKDMLSRLNGLPYLTIIDHIEHIISITGEDHVGLGSDFDGVPVLPAGMEDASRLPLLTEEFIKRGWSEERIRKILGLNMLRVFKENFS